MKRLSPVTFTSATYRLKRDSRFLGASATHQTILPLGASRLILTTDLLNFLFASRCQRTRERDLQFSARFDDLAVEVNPERERNSRNSVRHREVRKLLSGHDFVLAELLRRTPGRLRCLILFAPPGRTIS